jgi:hypothetical protein
VDWDAAADMLSREATGLIVTSSERQTAAYADARAISRNLTPGDSASDRDVGDYYRDAEEHRGREHRERDAHLDIVFNHV